MSTKALQILDSLIKSKSQKETRLTTLLKNPESNDQQGWYMYLPPCFNDSLDIKRTQRVVKREKIMQWTQGSSFSFKVGATIYDTPHGYDVWGEALKSIGIFIQVRKAIIAGTTEGTNTRSTGSVTFSLYQPNDKKDAVDCRGEFTLTQDDFVRLLISGPEQFPEIMRYI